MNLAFNFSIDIERSRDLVVKLFADPQFLGEYQEGFERKELKSGTPGTDGAVSMMYYKQGKNEMELEETITSNQLPDTFAARYHHKFMDNTMEVHFSELDGGRTRYEGTYMYTRIDWVMPRLIAILFPSVYRKQAEKWLHNFKRFVEAYDEPEEAN